MVQKIHRTFYMLAATGRITFAKLAKIRDMQGLRPPSKQEKTSPTRLNPKICRTFAKAKALVAKLVDAPDLGSGDFGRVGSSPIRRTTSIFLLYSIWKSPGAFFFLRKALIIRTRQSVSFRIW